MPKTIPFTNEAYAIVDEIIDKNNLRETMEERVAKLENNKLSNSSLIVRSSRDLMNGVSEDNLIAALKTDMKITQETAKKVINEIKVKILPLLKASEEKLAITATITQTVPTISILEISSNNEESQNTSAAPIKKPLRDRKSIMSQQRQETTATEKKSTDTYRESIE